MRPLPFFGDRRGGFGSLVPGRERPAIMVFLAWQWALPIFFPPEPCCERINIVAPSGVGRISRRSPRRRRTDSFAARARNCRSEERRVGKECVVRLDLVGGRIIPKKQLPIFY